jgi:hypothetical protein
MTNDERLYVAKGITVEKTKLVALIKGTGKPIDDALILLGYSPEFADRYRSTLSEAINNPIQQ